MFRIVAKGVGSAFAGAGIVGSSLWLVSEFAQGKSITQIIFDTKLQARKIMIDSQNNSITNFWLTNNAPLPSSDYVAFDYLVRQNKAAGWPESVEKGRTQFNNKMNLLTRLNQRWTTTVPVSIGDVEGIFVKSRYIWSKGHANSNRSIGSSKQLRDDGVLIYLHGGGYMQGSPIHTIPLCASISKQTGLTALTLDYKLAPEHTIQDSNQDVIKIYRWLIEEQGVSPSKIVIAGDSAGGGLSLLFLQNLRKENLPMPSCAVLLSPWADLVQTNPSIYLNSERDAVLNSNRMAIENNHFIQLAVPGDRSFIENSSYSPLHGNFRGLPPLYVMVGETEVLLDDSLKLAIKAKENRVSTNLEVVPHMMHSFPLFVGRFPEADEAASRISSFILSHGALKSPNKL